VAVLGPFLPPCSPAVETPPGAFDFKPNSFSGLGVMRRRPALSRPYLELSPAPPPFLGIPLPVYPPLSSCPACCCCPDRKPPLLPPGHSPFSLFLHLPDGLPGGNSLALGWALAGGNPVFVAAGGVWLGVGGLDPRGGVGGIPDIVVIRRIAAQRVGVVKKSEYQ